MTDAQTLLAKHPNYVPVIILPNKDINICKRRFLFPRDNNFGYALVSVRQHITGLKPSESLFFLIDDKLLNITELVGNFYDKYKRDKKPHDAFMYIKIFRETTFG
jgi:hypothetical protein